MATEQMQRDEAKVRKLAEMMKDILEEKLPHAEIQKIVDEKFDRITVAEFARGEQCLKGMGISDDVFARGWETVRQYFVKQIDSENAELPAGHPIRSYMLENDAIRTVVLEMKALLEKPRFIKNPWLEVYDKLRAYTKHLVRKQNQLFPALENHGVTGPARIMWTFDDFVKDGISKGFKLLDGDRVEDFLAFQPTLIQHMEDLTLKEEKVLFPMARKVLTEEEFRQMRIGEEEVGFANIEAPTGFLPKGMEGRVRTDVPTGFLKDFSSLLEKYHLGNVQQDEARELNVKNGLLTLEQINLIYQHMPVDLTFTDEKDIVKFYTDTKHRVFSRSAGVIGRVVQNCHPREILPLVERIINSFRAGEKEEAEFAFRRGEQAIYVTYLAVRDAEGNFRGVLEMMQDVAHIMELFNGKQMKKPQEIVRKKQGKNRKQAGFSVHTTLRSVFSQYPYLKDFLITLSPNYQNLGDPATLAAISDIEAIETIADRGGFAPEELRARLEEEVHRHEEGAKQS